MATFTIPKRVIPQKKTTEETMDALSLPFSLRTFLVEEFIVMDDLFEYRNKATLQKISELQTQLEKLHGEINIKRGALLEEKEIIITQDQEIYLGIMKEVEQAFLEQRKHLHIEHECTCVSRHTNGLVHRGFYGLAHRGFLVCPVIRTIVEELEEQGYFPGRETSFRHCGNNLVHVIDCEL